MVGNLARSGVRRVRPADPACHTVAGVRAGDDRCVRRCVVDPPRRDAALGDLPRTGRPHSCSRSPTSPITCGASSSATSARSAPTRRRSPTSSRRSTSPGPTRWPRCRPRSAIRRCCSVRCARRNRSRWSRCSTPRSQSTIGVIDWVVDAVAVRVIGGNALQIAEAARRRRAESDPRRHLRRAAARHPARQRADGARQALRARRRRPGRRERPRAAVHLGFGRADAERDRGARPLARPRERRTELAAVARGR